VSGTSGWEMAEGEMRDGTPAGQSDPGDGGRDASLNTLSARDEARRAELYAAALEYISEGFEVFPLSHVKADGNCSVAGTPHCHCKNDLEHAGKCQVLDHWDKEASKDPDQIADWWGPAPRYEVREGDAYGRGGVKVASAGDHVIAYGTWFPLGNIRLSMRNSRCIGVDTDPRHGGRESLGALRVNGIDLTATRTHRTARGGTHGLFRVPDDIEPRNYYAKPRGIAKGIDLIGKGFLYAPPSIIGAGAYQVTDPEVRIADLPSEVVDWIRDRQAECRGLPVRSASPPAPNGRRRRYGAAALAGEKKKLAECQGGRNIVLNNSALALGSLSEECSISEQEAYDALMQACETNGLIRDDGLGQCTATFSSGWNAGLRKPRHPDYKVTADDDGDDSEELAAITPRPWTQYGNGERLVDAYGDVLAWNMTRERWMTERNGVWRNGDNKTAFRFARRMIDSLASSEALLYPDDDGNPEDENGDFRSTRQKFLDKIRSWMCRSETSAAAEFGLTHDIMCCENSGFDTDPAQLNAPNGVISLRTEELIPHAEVTGRFTMQVAASYSKDAQCQKFMKFLEQAQPDKEIRRWLQVRTGYAAFGDATEQVAQFDYGDGGCGKSVFSDSIVAALGSYAQLVFVETLTRARKDGTVPTDIASMAGKRYLVASETRPGQSLDEQAFKQLTGDRSVRARKMREDFSDFLRTWTIHLIANDPVHVSDDGATWRRIWVTKWENPVPESARDKYLLDAIIEQELPGVLRWIVEGARIWAEEGLVVPDKVRGWTAKYRAEEDYLALFVREACVETEPVGHKDKTVGQRLPGVIAEVYKNWARNAGAPDLGRNVLARRLVAKGYERADSGSEYFLTLMVKYFGE
jgi:P4 family phage/plasmid primase-like protien